MIKIKECSNKTEAGVLRKYGHRVFQEVDAVGQVRGYFVECGELASDTKSAPPSGKKVFNEHPLARNAALMWVSGKGAPWPESTGMHKIARSAMNLAGKPIRRGELVELIAADVGCAITSISPCLSKLYKAGCLVVAGDN